MKLLAHMRYALMPSIPAVGEDRTVRKFLILLTVINMMGFQLWRSLFNNFAVEEAGIDAWGMGIIQSVREVPGFLALCVVFIIIFIREQSLAVISIAFLGLGVGITGLWPTTEGLIVTTLIFSFGFHYFETVNQSMTLQYLPAHQAPQFLGQVRSWASLGSLASVGAVYVCSQFLSYRALFIVGGVVVILGAVYAAVRFPRFSPRVPQRTHMVFRRRYWLFYVLTFLSGARRQIFVAFAVFLMVKNFGFTVQEVALLYLANNVITLFSAPAIGGLVHRFGERKIISLEYAGLILVFLGYAFTQSKAVLVGLYIIDHLFFNMSIAIRTFFQKKADPRDVAPSMAVAFTINHIAAVFIPVLGGAIWMLDYRYTFYGGALIALTSLIFAQFVDTPIGRAGEIEREVAEAEASAGAMASGTLAPTMRR